MKHTLLLALLALLFLTGCEAVFTEQPIGDEAVRLDASRWQGTWFSGDIVLMTAVIDAEAGVLQAAWMERTEQGVSLERVTGQVRRSGDWMFINLLNEPREETAATAGDTADTAGESADRAGESADRAGESADRAEDSAAAALEAATEYFWARLKFEGDNRAVVWWPDQEHMRSAVTEGRLPGTIKQDNDVLLGKLGPEHLQLINAPGSTLLDWQNPVVFVRVSN